EDGCGGVFESTVKVCCDCHWVYLLRVCVELDKCASCIIGSHAVVLDPPRSRRAARRTDPSAALPYGEVSRRARCPRQRAQRSCAWPRARTCRTNSVEVVRRRGDRTRARHCFARQHEAIEPTPVGVAAPASVRG